MSRVEFVSYTGKYPTLCDGILTLRIDGEVVEFPKESMTTCGYIRFADDYDEIIDVGEWVVKTPKRFRELRHEINDCVNEHVEWGCCGGCIQHPKALQTEGRFYIWEKHKHTFAAGGRKIVT